MSAKTRYDSLASERSQFLNIAEEAAKLYVKGFSLLFST